MPEGPQGNAVNEKRCLRDRLCPLLPIRCDVDARETDEVTGDIRGLDRKAMEDPTWRLAMASAQARYTPIVCLLCGCPDVHSDEVVDHGVLLLGECPRCEHRWTRSLRLSTRREARQVAAVRVLRTASEAVPTAA